MDLRATLGRNLILAAVAIANLFLAGRALADESIKGQILAGGAPIAQSTVTLWEASTGAPKQLAQTKTDGDGRFEVRSKSGGSDTILYLIAAGGEPKAGKGGGSSSAIKLLAVLGNRAPEHVVVNEFTTVASTFTAAQFIKDGAISGNPLGLRIAAMNVPNFANLQTGSWGSVIVDPLNSNLSTTLANFDTLASLITAAATVANDDWRSRFFQAATPAGGETPSNTLDAMAGIARQSWAHSKELFGLFDEVYPQPKDGARRAAPFVPYLSYAPADFALMLSFAGGGMNGPGRLMFDANGNMWSGQNWTPGGQNSLAGGIGGFVVELAPNGAALSPPIAGFGGMGIDGPGWGTGVTLDNVWASGLNGKIAVLDFDGRPVGKESDIPFALKESLQGIGVAPNGDVWITSIQGNRLLHFPGGKLKEGRIVEVAGLASPFDVEIDAQNRVWVSNNAAGTVIRFPKDDPTKVETFRVGLLANGMAIDSKGDVWVASNVTPGFPMPKLPPGLPQLKQWAITLTGLIKELRSGRVKSTGIVSMIRPDGTQPVPSGFTGGGVLSVPWGLNIDGNDDVWVASSAGHQMVYMAGSDTKGHPAGTKTGDLLHAFSNGTLQYLTDISIDPAGNVWTANNVADFDVFAGANHDPVISTWGGGYSVTVLYGAAPPVKPPKMGPVRTY